jgi:hypothetical protein
MSEPSSLICAAGNVAAPAWLALLGLVSMVEVRGPHWAATDEEIDAFLRLIGAS